MLILLIFLLWISPGFGEENPSGCRPEDFEFCTSPCTSLWAKCGEDKDCSMDLCSYWYPACNTQADCPRLLPPCWELVSRCRDDFLSEETRNLYKRGILNKNFAYLLLKLRPIRNQTSNYGVLSSGRIRRITGTFGTEFLGKRGSSGRQTKPKASTSTPPRFYSLPLNQFARNKVVKRVGDDWPRRRLVLRGGGRLTAGSEFLGKRGARGPEDARTRRLVGSELLGKRNSDGFGGSELLGKRTPSPISASVSRKIEEDFLGGSELLGKKSSANPTWDISDKRLSGQEKNVVEPYEWLDYDPDLTDEAFYKYRPSGNPKQGEKRCEKSGACERTKMKGESSSED